ncbi:nuclear protein [Myotisia sp. PD_48]|nr:nuclear protein [Myotisia sp. PD_48]
MPGQRRRDIENSPSTLSSTPPPSHGGALLSPSASFSSDKENRGRPGSASRPGKRKSNILPRASSDIPSPMASSSGTRNKRRRLSPGENVPFQQTQTAHQRVLGGADDKEFYDPDQDPSERRAVRKDLRDLTTHLNDSRAEFLQPDSEGILRTVVKANELFKSVKQTSDATLDSRLLVAAADLTYKRTAQATLGDSSIGIDVDEFVSKCITFMRSGDANNRLTEQHYDGDGDDDEEDGDLFDWDYLGRRACFPNNHRPAVSGFLLGPLSLQKRIRQLTQRRAREVRDPSQLIRPNDLKATDLEKDGNATLTAICSDIREILVDRQAESQLAVRRELDQLGQPTEAVAFEIMNRHGISDDGGVPLLPFCINPRSFGQTIENLFYISFLVRDSSVGVSMDSKKLPTLIPASPIPPSEARARGVQRHQAVFSLDFDTWKQLVNAFDIKESVIPHREETHERAEEGSTEAIWHQPSP